MKPPIPNFHSQDGELHERNVAGSSAYYKAEARHNRILCATFASNPRESCYPGVGCFQFVWLSCSSATTCSWVSVQVIDWKLPCVLEPSWQKMSITEGWLAVTVLGLRRNNKLIKPTISRNTASKWMFCCIFMNICSTIASNSGFENRKKKRKIGAKENNHNFCEIFHISVIVLRVSVLSA